MSRIKSKQTLRTLGKLVQVETERALRERGIEVPDELADMVAAVCYPNVTPYLKFQQAALREAKKSFGKFCSQNTDRAVIVLEEIYKAKAAVEKETKKGRTGKSKIVRFLLEHNCLVLHAGKFYSISEIDLDKCKGTLCMAGLKKARTGWRELTDGDIAQYLGEPTDRVKNARQWLASKGKQESPLPKGK